MFALASADITGLLVIIGILTVWVLAHVIWDLITGV